MDSQQRASSTNVAVSAGSTFISVTWLAIALLATGTLAWLLNWQLLLSLDFTIVWEYRVALLRGLGNTLLLTLVAGSLGLAFGTILAVLSQLPIRIVQWMVIAYVELWRNTPLLVKIFWIHFALPIVTGIETTVLQSGLLAMVFGVTAYFTEIVRAGIESIPRGQWEASDSLALPVRIKWQKVILPQAIRIVIPPLVSLLINMFKATSILTVLGVAELMTTASRISTFTLKPIEVFTSVALIYFVVGYGLSRASMKLEQALSKADR